MDKDKKMFIGIILLLLFFMVFVGAIAFRDKKEEFENQPPVVDTDAKKFKEEYEALNNTIRDKDGKMIKEVFINESNPVDIVTEEEAIKLLEEGTGILYFGFSDCPWCRSMLPILLSTLDNMSIDRLYYLDIGSIRDTMVLDEKNKPVVSVKGTDGYYRLLELLDSVLSPYILTSDNGKKIDTKEKRMFAPTVVGFKEGKIVGIHVGTVEGQKSGYDDLTDEQKEELSLKFQELINKVYDINCDENC